MLFSNPLFFVFSIPSFFPSFLKHSNCLKQFLHSLFIHISYFIYNTFFFCIKKEHVKH
nr:MAG TPA: hypothetical protein [Caudoviricetes sp.]